MGGGIPVELASTTEIGRLFLSEHGMYIGMKSVKIRYRDESGSSSTRTIIPLWFTRAHDGRAFVRAY